MKKINLVLAIAFLFTAAFYLSSCGKKEQTEGGDKKVDIQSDVQKTEDTKKETPTPEGKSNELGISEGMPADYPSDVPQPLNSKCLGSLHTSEGTVVTFESGEKPKDILSQFQKDLEKNGYNKSEGEMMSDDGGLALWTKDKKEVSIMLAWDKEKKLSSVVVTYK